MLDLPEHGLRDLLSQSVPAAITGALQLLPDFLRHLAADLARGLGWMLGSPGSNIGVDLPGRERQKIVLTAIARVRRNLPGLTSEVGPDGIDQGNKLHTVAHAMRQSMRHDDLLGPVDRRLRVVALDEAVLGQEHAAVGIGKVALRLGIRLF